MDWIIVKQNEHGEDVWQYEASLLAKHGQALLMDARFNRDDFMFNGLRLCRGDRFIEAYYTQHWFNIMEIYQGESEHLKGWYCNVTYPAEIGAQRIAYKDLALDVLIFPDQRSMVLDEDEFDALSLPAAIKEKAREIPQEILLLFKRFNYQPISSWFDKI